MNFQSETQVGQAAVKATVSVFFSEYHSGSELRFEPWREDANMRHWLVLRAGGQIVFDQDYARTDLDDDGGAKAIEQTQRRLAAIRAHSDRAPGSLPSRKMACARTVGVVVPSPPVSRPQV